ncbi:MAG: hypothetical protein RBT63_05250 [Bdellovibrionales bacterium]|nr:hypothetical protein [Bdellovibrionales bacterium]
MAEISRMRPRVLFLTFLCTPLLFSLHKEAFADQDTQAESSNQPMNTKEAAPTSGASLISKLLLQAAKSGDAVQATRLLQKAREELAKEGFNSADAARITNMIDALELKLKKTPGSSHLTGLSPVPGSVNLQNILNAPESSAPAPAPAPPAAAPPAPVPSSAPASSPTTSASSQQSQSVESVESIKRTIGANPEIHDTMWEISRSRLSRDAQNIEGIVRSRTGKSIQELEAEEAKARAEGYKPGPFLEMLNRLNLLNLDISKANLKLKQEFDGVALDILAEQLIRDATKYSIPVGVLQGVLTDIGTSGRFIGVSSEVLMTFIINANLALRLSDLYGIELSNSEKEIVLLVIFSTAKVAGQYGAHSSAVTGILGSFGETLGRLKSSSPGEMVDFLKRFLKNPAIAKTIPPAAQEVLATAENESKGGKPKSGALRTIASKINLMSLVKAGAHGARSATETYILGQAAKYVFRSARHSRRAIHNENFRRFLMTPTGEGFFKLMALSLNDGIPSTSPVRAESEEEFANKIKFIMNIARSSKACGLDDLKAVQVDATSAYACTGNQNTARFNRLLTELLTYDEIPQSYVTDLRVVSREHRLRMAELIVQMQFLDGDRSPNEVQYFRNVIARTLGVDHLQELEYFDRLHAFIQENGGMEPSVLTPTGFTVRNVSAPSPYDMDRGYSPINAPEPPAMVP